MTVNHLLSLSSFVDWVIRSVVTLNYPIEILHCIDFISFHTMMNVNQSVKDIDVHSDAEAHSKPCDIHGEAMEHEDGDILKMGKVMKGYVRYVIVRDPTNQKEYSIGVRYVFNTQGGRILFNYLRKNIFRAYVGCPLRCARPMHAPKKG